MNADPRYQYQPTLQAMEENIEALRAALSEQWTIDNSISVNTRRLGVIFAALATQVHDGVLIEATARTVLSYLLVELERKAPGQVDFYTKVITETQKP